jgi:uncharacterized RDD family membrane protein YckC
MIHHAPRTLFWLVFSALLLLAGPVWAGGLSVADGRGHTWVVRHDSASLGVLHRPANAEPAALRHAGQFNGQLAKRGLAASGEQLWLIYDDHTVQTLQALADGPQGQWRFPQTVPAALPAGDLRDAAALNAHPWALLAVEPQTAQSQSADTRPEKTGPPPSSATRRDNKQAATQPTKPVDQLLVLRRGAWQPIALPNDWPHRQPVWLVASDGSDLRPRLIVRPDQSSQLWVYRWQNDAWQKQTYQLDGPGQLAPLLVQQQLFVAQRHEPTGPMRITVRRLRGGTVRPLGEIKIEGADANAPWSITGRDLSVALFAERAAKADDETDPAKNNADDNQPTDGDAPPAEAPKEDEGESWLSSWFGDRGADRPEPGPIDLVTAEIGVHEGELLQPPVQMRLVAPQSRSQASEIIIVAALCLALVLMLSFWRRDTAATVLELPGTTSVAGMLKRALAGFLDIAPALVLAMGAFKLSPEQLLAHWPGQPPADTWYKMLPGLVSILLIITHTALGEAIWGRSLGKALTGLRVVNIDGQTPRRWQLIVRNSLKVLELVVPILLLLAILSPRRQRLGDIVARTVVIEAAEEQASERSSEDE